MYYNRKGREQGEIRRQPGRQVSKKGMVVNMAFDFGYRLRFLRKKKKLSQKQVAERIRVSKASISGYENNLTMPSVDVLVKLALLYGVTTDYLTGLDNRKIISLDGFTENQQKQVMEIIESVRKLAGCASPAAGGKRSVDF